MTFTELLQTGFTLYFFRVVPCYSVVNNIFLAVVQKFYY